MRITDLLDKRSISLTGTPKTKSEALDQIIDLMVKSGKINDREAYRAQVYEREEESTTGICHSSREMRRGDKAGACSHGHKGWSLMTVSRFH